MSNREVGKMTATQTAMNQKMNRLALSQALLAMVLFVALTVVISAKSEDSPSPYCCVGDTQCEYQDQCFDPGFVYGGWKCVVELSACDWVPVG